MTTNTTSTASQAPAVSISHDTELQSMLNDAYALATDAYACGNDFGTIGKLGEAEDKIFAYIDAKLAQARQEAWVAERAAEVEARDRDEWKARATAAEAKLEAIRQGIDGLIGRPDNWIKREEVLALFQPQPQADESGLPG